jgi:hypothetical protein
MGRHARGQRYSAHPEQAARFNAELRAIAMLIDAHRDEFDEAVEGLDQVASLDALRKVHQRRQVRRR